MGVLILNTSLPWALGFVSCAPWPDTWVTTNSHCPHFSPPFLLLKQTEKYLFKRHQPSLEDCSEAWSSLLALFRIFGSVSTSISSTHLCQWKELCNPHFHRQTTFLSQGGVIMIFKGIFVFTICTNKSCRQWHKVFHLWNPSNFLSWLQKLDACKLYTFICVIPTVLISRYNTSKNV